MSRSAPDGGGGGPLPTSLRSPLVVRFMEPWFERFLRRHLNAVRIARWGLPSWPQDMPLVVYANHPAWWDVALFAVLTTKVFQGFSAYGPIDAAMLKQYGFFRKIGLFGVALDTPRGAAMFLRASADILAEPDRLLWVTAQGRFADPRERPLGLRPGIAHLAEFEGETCFLPMAVEYPFWSERGAEALVAFGKPMTSGELGRHGRAARLELLEGVLTRTMDRLAHDAVSRDPSRFETVLAGRPGIGGIYDAWRRIKAASRGRRFDPAHRGEPAAR